MTSLTYILTNDMPTRNIQGTQVSRASVIILENNIWQ